MRTEHPVIGQDVSADSATQRLPVNVVALGFVSLLMGMSSQMIHGLLPVFLVTVLGASVLSVGVIEGIAEATNSLAKVLSGTFSDWLGRRKPLGIFEEVTTRRVLPLLKCQMQFNTLSLEERLLTFAGLPARAYAANRF
jgi:hypothetical protein